MKATSSVLKALFQNLSSDKQASLFRHLPDAEVMAIENAVPLILKAPPDCLDEIHWSWIVDALKDTQLKEKKLFLNILSTKIRPSLCQAFAIQKFEEMISPIGKDFLDFSLKAKLSQEQEIIPKEAFAHSKLFKLLSISKKKLIDLIDYLSFYDLSTTLRTIVDTKTLKLITSFFSKDELDLIKKMGHQKWTHPSRPLNLKKWDETEQSLRLLLHKRGLHRFAIALSSEHPDFQWHVCHKFDIGRGQWLLSQAKQKPVFEIAEEVTKQVEELLVRYI